MAIPKVSGIREAKEILNRLDKQGQNQLQRDFHKDIAPALTKVSAMTRISNSQVRGKVPNMFSTRGRTRNTGADIKASFRPSAQYGRSIALVTARGRNGQVGFEYAELAGINRSQNGGRSRIPGTTTRGSRKGE